MDAVPLVHAVAALSAAAVAWNARALTRPTERLPLRSALGRVLGQGLSSPFDLPAFDNAAMDGFAVIAADWTAQPALALHCAGVALAGKPWAGVALRGQCVRITTGAQIPPGFDTVVPHELTTGEASVHLRPGAASPKAGQHVRRRGEEFTRGAVALRAGSVLTPAALGLAASLHASELAVRPRLRVAYFSTGQELRSLTPSAPDDRPTPPAPALGIDTGVVDTNRISICAWLQALGSDVTDAALGEERREIEAALTQAARDFDVIITTGGMGEGATDTTRAAALSLGGPQAHFWRLALRPGKPFAFAELGAPAGADHAGALYFGLPGNPAAALTALTLLVRPALMRMQGLPADGASARVRLSEPVQSAIGRTDVLRAVVARDASGELWATPVGQQSSSMLSGWAQANALIVLGDAQAQAQSGDWVDVLYLSH